MNAGPTPRRAGAALVRAATCTGADLVLAGPDDVDLEHGVGAVLRYRDPATPA